ncbi:uncharacterized protein MONBRDRAFT_31866 [Monosiga brevicollis MX1]|uniref:JmjC domain-containing protein n=1 Tax=Monosiga brevicollis TaxID=81824 RepID=A9UVW4_MONBE|nr:uncharacterized protein MONBRDRAFT_31866 [Monosiga brevicollis MX1]EDQ90461.1 predicted protein [Monosiga brevicollis MX1]|eukprot:XP_001744512.1 hypothetical protein [Monosiga brevicollis MX1]
MAVPAATIVQPTSSCSSTKLPIYGDRGQTATPEKKHYSENQLTSHQVNQILQSCEHEFRDLDAYSSLVHLCTASTTAAAAIAAHPVDTSALTDTPRSASLTQSSSSGPIMRTMQGLELPRATAGATTAAHLAVEPKALSTNASNSTNALPSLAQSREPLAVSHATTSTTTNAFLTLNPACGAADNASTPSASNTTSALGQVSLGPTQLPSAPGTLSSMTPTQLQARTSEPELAGLLASGQTDALLEQAAPDFSALCQWMDIHLSPRRSASEAESTGADSPSKRHKNHPSTTLDFSTGSRLSLTERSPSPTRPWSAFYAQNSEQNQTLVTQSQPRHQDHQRQAYPGSTQGPVVQLHGSPHRPSPVPPPVFAPPVDMSPARGNRSTSLGGNNSPQIVHSRELAPSQLQHLPTSQPWSAPARVHMHHSSPMLLHDGSMTPERHVPRCLSSVELEPFHPASSLSSAYGHASPVQPGSHPDMIDILIMADQQTCRVTFMTNDNNDAVDRAIAVAVGRRPGTFGLRDDQGSVAISAPVLQFRGGPFELIDFEGDGRSLSRLGSPHTPLRHRLTASSAEGLRAPRMEDMLGSPMSTRLSSELSSLGSEGGSHIQIVPPTAARLAALNSENAALHIPASVSSFAATPVDAAVATSRSNDALSKEEAKGIIHAVDARLEQLGLCSQRQKTCFLTLIVACQCWLSSVTIHVALNERTNERTTKRLGVKISQQHYSTIIKCFKRDAWTGGIRASFSLRKMRVCVLDMSDEEWMSMKRYLPQVHAELQRRREFKRQMREQQRAARLSTGARFVKGGMQRQARQARQARHVGEMKRSANGRNTGGAWPAKRVLTADTIDIQLLNQLLAQPRSSWDIRLPQPLSAQQQGDQAQQGWQVDQAQHQLAPAHPIPMAPPVHARHSPQHRASLAAPPSAQPKAAANSRSSTSTPARATPSAAAAATPHGGRGSNSSVKSRRKSDVGTILRPPTPPKDPDSGEHVNPKDHLQCLETALATLDKVIAERELVDDDSLNVVYFAGEPGPPSCRKAWTVEYGPEDKDKLRVGPSIRAVPRATSKKAARDVLDELCRWGLHTSEATSMVVEGFADLLHISKDKFTAENLARIDPNANVDTYTHSFNANAPEANLENGQTSWRFTSGPVTPMPLKEYARYQRTFRPKPDADGTVEVKFATNLDLQGGLMWDNLLNELHQRLPESLLWDGPESLLSMLDHPVPGLSTVQCLFSVEGCRKPGHQENNCLAVVNLNLDGHHEPEIQRMCQQRKLEAWWPDVDELLAAGISVQRFEQPPGALVLTNPACITWTQSSGRSHAVTWNLAIPTAHQLRQAWEAYDRHSKQNSLSIVPMKQLLFTMTSTYAKFAPGLQQALQDCWREALNDEVEVCRQGVRGRALRCQFFSVPTEQAALHCVSCNAELFNFLFLKPYHDRHRTLCWRCRNKAARRGAHGDHWLRLVYFRHDPEVFNERIKAW